MCVSGGGGGGGGRVLQLLCYNSYRSLQEYSTFVRGIVGFAMLVLSGFGFSYGFFFMDYHS